ncbi:MAG: hypothetical protein HQK51_05410 [Oligoflexia bacterium]|nr:hypothetical protein [Oligoflexia bacterium]
MIFLFFLLLTISNEMLYSQETAINYKTDDTPPVLINIYHNRVLDDLVIIKMSGLDQDSQLSPLEVKRRLETTGLFSQVVVNKRNNIVDIIVDEKSNWMIIPYLYSDGNSTVYGVAGGMLAALGQNNRILGRYQFGKDNREAALLLRDEYFRNTFWALGIGYDYEDSFHKIYYDRKTFEKRHKSYQGLCPKVGYHLDPYFYVEANGCWEKHKFENYEKVSLEGTQVSNKISGIWSNFYLREGLARGKSLRVYYETSNSYSDFHFYKMGAFSEVSLFLKNDLNWILRSNAEMGSSLAFYQLFESSAAKLRGFNEQQFRDKYYISIQNDFFLSSLHLWKIIVRPLLFLDGAYFQKGLRLGVGPGFHIYFKTIAMPALQFWAAYGINPNGLTISLSLGLNFK